MAGSPAAAGVLGLVALQLIFVAVIPAVTRTQLNPGGDKCYLNASGSVCDFVYVTSGMGILFTALLGLGAAATHRADATVFLAPICGSLSLFAAFWWMVLAITITIRGGQATDDGLPQTTARNAVIGLSWMEAILFFFALLATIYDRFQHTAYRRRLEKSRSVLGLEDRDQFRTQYAATQALGSTPMV